ncbi:MAG: BtpA/SgcQ family protein [Planctomycetota bacterium]
MSAPRIALPFAPGRCALVGAVHLLPLPGSPGWAAAGRPGIASVLERARADARAYLDAGFDGVIVENYGDAPFFKDAVPAETVACLTRCAAAVKDEVGAAPLGVNVLRNDAHAALACAVAVGAAFVRVNVLSGASVTDQGLIEGAAASALRLRAALGAGPGDATPVAVFADVHVKHAVPLGELDLARAAADTAERGRADALIVSGAATGAAPAPARVEVVQAAAPGVPVWLGSGLTPLNAALLVPLLDGAVVGSACEREGLAGNPVDPARARALVDAVRAAG